MGVDMCQAYEGERSFISACERTYREEGYKAQKEGKCKCSNPKKWDSEKEHWNIGWEIAKANTILW